MKEKRTRLIRLSALLLLFCLLAAQLPVTAYAAADSVPIYIGDAAVDYMAEEILDEIPTAGKSDAEKIRAVYDWIIQNCTRYNWDGTYYFDRTAVRSASGSAAYQQTLRDMASRGELVYRYDGDDLSIQDSGSEWDSNAAVAGFASSMMYTRCGSCAEFSALFTVLVGHLGYDSRLVSGYFHNSNGTTVDHVWNYVLIDGQYYWFDIMESVQCSTDPQGIADGGNGFSMSVMDMLKLGRLYLNNGSWEGQQIVSAEWIQAATSVQFVRNSGSADYGYQWWVRQFQGYDAYFAQGHYGQFLFVVPEQNLIAAFTSHNTGGTDKYWQFVNEIVSACA